MRLTVFASMEWQLLHQELAKLCKGDRFNCHQWRGSCQGELFSVTPSPTNRSFKKIINDGIGRYQESLDEMSTL